MFDNTYVFKALHNATMVFVGIREQTFKTTMLCEIPNILDGAGSFLPRIDVLRFNINILYCYLASSY